MLGLFRGEARRGGLGLQANVPGVQAGCSTTRGPAASRAAGQQLHAQAALLGRRLQPGRVQALPAVRLEQRRHVAAAGQGTRQAALVEGTEGGGATAARHRGETWQECVRARTGMGSSQACMPRIVHTDSSCCQCLATLCCSTMRRTPVTPPARAGARLPAQASDEGEVGGGSPCLAGTRAHLCSGA